MTPYYCRTGFALTVPQPGTDLLLDAIPEVIMYGLQYRNFGTYETIVGNYTIDAHANATLDDHAGIRWFELRKSGLLPWELYQEDTLAPDAEHRWMGSIAMNGSGTIALGYSISSELTSPGIRVTGRFADDALGLMTPGEVNMLNGQGFFDGNRWGDYSFMAVDPADDNTFWFTGEYANNGEWGTQIIAFTIEPERGAFLLPRLFPRNSR